MKQSYENDYFVFEQNSLYINISGKGNRNISARPGLYCSSWTAWDPWTSQERENWDFRRSSSVERRSHSSLIETWSEEMLGSCPDQKVIPAPAHQNQLDQIGCRDVMPCGGVRTPIKHWFRLLTFSSAHILAISRSGEHQLFTRSKRKQQVLHRTTKHKLK